MIKLTKKSLKTIGMPPGELVHVGEPKTHKVKLTLYEYSEDHSHETEAKSLDEFFPIKEKHNVLWFNVTGIHEVEIIKKIGEEFNIHSLLLEDILNTEQRPKMEDFEDYIFISLKAFMVNNKDEIVMDQISIVAGENFIISFQESDSDLFRSVRERIKQGKGLIRKMGCDYLAYTLIDSIVDNYFIVMEKIAERIEALEEDVITNPESQDLMVIKTSKRDIITMRRAIGPLREVIRNMEKPSCEFVTKEVRFFLTDVYDHIVHILDSLETFKEILSTTVEIYISSINFKMNEVMKVLTVIGTIFLPLSFIASVYGMNFKNMPELEWHWGYGFAWLIMAGIAGLMLWGDQLAREAPVAEAVGSELAHAAAPGLAEPA
ncbi:magnesium/cobalt transporter CorA, partial [bacterium]|nr:magnesium/cobalt transporter CorA [bacterium]